MRIAFDFDGTLCDIQHRLHHIQKPHANWPAFFKDCVHDAPIVPLIQVCNALALTGNRIEVWSGRSDIVRAESEAWLHRHAVPFSVLRMRKDGDYRADDVVKAEWLTQLTPEFWPELAFDDRDRVVKMWRAHGIRCCQVAPGDF